MTKSAKEDPKLPDIRCPECGDESKIKGTKEFICEKCNKALYPKTKWNSYRG